MTNVPPFSDSMFHDVEMQGAITGCHPQERRRFPGVRYHMQPLVPSKVNPTKLSAVVDDEVSENSVRSRSAGPKHQSKRGRLLIGLGNVPV
jgi:hypothetical protein